MSEEKILGGNETIEDSSQKSGSEAIREDSLEKKENVFEQGEKQAQDKIKQAEDQIKTSSGAVKDEEQKIGQYAKDVAGLGKVEDQIHKLTEIATQNSPKMALKVARTLNSNYILDEMHDRLIDEEELRKVLIEKGFIDKI